VELLVANPTQGRAVVHGVDQQIADVLWRANGNEEPVHRF
jgi:hypothetical protein